MSIEIVLAVAGIGLSVIGIPLSFYVARRGRRRPVIRAAVDFDLIVSPDDGTFRSGVLKGPDGEPVTTISRTCYAIWNHQGDTIRGVDIVPDDHLRIQLGENDVPLFARVVSRSRQQNKLEVEIVPSSKPHVDIKFDFLDAGDGGVIEVIHQAVDRPKLTGTVRGASLAFKGKASLSLKVVNDMSRPWYRKADFYVRIFATLFVLVFVAFLAAVGILSLSDDEVPMPPMVAGAHEVVDTNNFNLGSVAGQRDFASAVTRVQWGSSSIGGSVKIFSFVMLLPIVSIPAAIWIGRWRVRKRIPSSVARILETVGVPSNNHGLRTRALGGLTPPSGIGQSSDDSGVDALRESVE